MNKLPLLALAAFVGAAPSAFAGQPYVTDDAATAGARVAQIEATLTRTNSAFGAGGREHSLETLAKYSYGVSDRLDLGIQATHLRNRGGASEASGIGNFELSAKLGLAEISGLALAIGASFTPAVSSAREARGLGAAKGNGSLFLLATRDTGFGSVSGNAGVATLRQADPAVSATQRDRQWQVSGNVVTQITEKFSAGLDVGALTNPDRSAERWTGYALLGIGYAPSADLELAAGYLRNFRDGPVRADALTAGLTWRF